MKNIQITGARENNLKNLNISIPRNKIVCFVGVSGSGKSTIAFDIVAKEGQRQYFESLSSYARRYLAKSNRPDIDSITGISSTIVINQKRIRGNPRSTVGTITESYNYLRLLFSRCGFPIYDSSYYSFNHPLGACSKCRGLGRSLEIDLDKIIDFDKSLNEGGIKHSEWKVGGRMFSIIKATRYYDLDKKLSDFSEYDLKRLLYSPKTLWQDESEYSANKWTYQGIVTRIMDRNTSVHRGPSQSDLFYFKFLPCTECRGLRLNTDSLKVKLNGNNIGEVANMSIIDCLDYLKNVNHPHAQVILPRLIESLTYLIDVGLGYLSLNRSSDTLSGGEAQRVKMARQLGSDLIETIYVLDEPTTGLHPKDVNNVIRNLKKLKNAGNSVIVVEHDASVMASSDSLIEIGPGGGKKGGKIVFMGTYDEMLKSKNSLTSKYLNEKEGKYKKEYRKPSGFLKIKNANRNNLKNINIDIPKGVLVSLTGVSGAGKSSLVEEILDQYDGRVVNITQSPIGGMKRSCLATYVGAMDSIRSVISKKTGMSASLFAFNSKGACDECKGLGSIDMDMNFLGNVIIKCSKCSGLRYKEKVLRYLYKGKNIAEILSMSAGEIKDFFDDITIKEKMNLLLSVGLDYLEIGQTLDTLSGGESQRLKLASRIGSKGEFYILDEPTTGLHFADIEKLLYLLNMLVDAGNTVLVIEHNIDVIRASDWVIDIGPDGGNKGGRIIAEGKPIDIKKVNESYTGRYI